MAEEPFLSVITRQAMRGSFKELTAAIASIGTWNKQPTPFT